MLAKFGFWAVNEEGFASGGLSAILVVGMGPITQAKRQLHFFTSKKQKLRQCAALPFVCCDDGVFVLLVTTRNTRRWILPKGWTKASLPAHKVAAGEAYEEAGVKGNISKRSIGSFSYRKRLHVFASATCVLEVYPLEVTRQYIEWREKHQRKTVWLPAKEAAERLSNKRLAQIIVDFSQRCHCAD